MSMPDQTPDTMSYMIAGFAVFWIITFAFVVSLWARMRSLAKDADVLRQVIEVERKES
jgi:hypothetical protein